MNKEYKTFKINISKSNCNCYIVERSPHQETVVKKISYKDLIFLLQEEINQFNNNNSISNDDYFFIKFFGILFSIYFVNLLILFNLTD